ncbi:hypothetical protein PVAP13_6KG096700 [Panicum virgatum]|uniref:Photosystem II 10 kDa polypeptide, chloroplastic n=1 Tax=Panicum virgatum TaxID=38727 RepID=A0A8T0R9U4_PANVG|nr:hypothetical protein PVAP13_6KG096700 [Panicum virgatum]
MAASMISSSALVAPARAQGLPSLGRRASSFAVVCGTGKKIKTDKPFGIGGGLTVDVDASGRKVKVRRVPVRRQVRRQRRRIQPNLQRGGLVSHR